jgi:hypothetical protein
MNKLPNKTYVSPRIETTDGALRIASKIVHSKGLQYVKVKNQML